MNSLDVYSESLDGIKLIEAGAGTGKTFSLSVLVLRMILEGYKEHEYNDILKDILIVTFTNAATEEMRIRISKFIDYALNYYEEGSFADNPGKEFYDYLSRIAGNDDARKDKIRRLKLAKYNLDEASIYTIHSFSQRMLAEFSADTGFFADFSVIPDESELIKYYVYEFWREKINIKGSKYEELDLGSNDINIMVNSVNKFLEGKELVGEGLYIDMLHELNSYVEKRIKKRKEDDKLLSFNDMIRLLYDKVRKNERLAKKIRSKYRAVFVDEFQDTDEKQYGIFKKVFIENNDDPHVFFIGDPKQAIYSFRGADVNVYYKAKDEIKEIRFLTTNYRSSANFIRDANKLFGNLSDKTSSVEGIRFDYNELRAANKEAENKFDFLPDVIGGYPGIICYDVNADNGYANANSIKEKTVILVKNILARSKYKKSDLAILVRGRDEAKSIKALLDSNNIDSVIQDDTKVIQTEEAQSLYYILRAALFPSESNIRTALYGKLPGYTIKNIIEGPGEGEYDKFVSIRQAWESEGIFPAVLKIMNLFGLWYKAGVEHDVEKDREITNLLHIAEILNEKEVRSRFSPVQLLEWFGREINEPDEASGYELRVEGDTEKVRILTIHKSKGLEYPVVILPNLNFYEIGFKRTDVHVFYHDGWKYTYGKPALNDSVFLKNRISENIRLLYVAITRARDYAFVFDFKRSNRGGHNNVSFFKHLTEQAGIENIFGSSGLFCERFNLTDVSLPEPDGRATDVERKVKDFTGDLSLKWQVTSYSELDEHQVSMMAEECTGNEDEYDNFIFSLLPRGAGAGNVIHNLLEECDFAGLENFVIPDKYLKFAGTDNAREMFNEFISHVVYANYQTGAGKSFNLKEIENVFKEEEFYFSYDGFAKEKLQEILPGVTLSENEFTKSGVVHGFIDMLFEHEGKVYILDWKSNYLGCNKESYTQDKLEAAIRDNNYQLQYYIYSVALFRFLGEEEFRHKFGGVFYVFVRGVRKHENYGIYYTMPDIKRIKYISEEVFE